MILCHQQTGTLPEDIKSHKVKFQVTISVEPKLWPRHYTTRVLWGKICIWRSFSRRMTLIPLKSRLSPDRKHPHSITWYGDISYRDISYGDISSEDISYGDISYRTQQHRAAKSSGNPFDYRKYSMERNIGSRLFSHHILYGVRSSDFENAIFMHCLKCRCFKMITFSIGSNHCPHIYIPFSILFFPLADSLVTYCQKPTRWTMYWHLAAMKWHHLRWFQWPCHWAHFYLDNK